MTALLEARGLRKRYDGVHVVDGVSLSIGAAERVGLVGESGSGKSTMARLLLRLEDVDDGTLLFDGLDVTRQRGRALAPLRRRAQLVFQDAASALNPLRTVLDLVAEGLDVHDLARGEARRARVVGLLREVGLDEALLDRRPRELSGGQKQRVGLARALAVSPELLICDEPVSALDVSVQAQVVNLLAELCSQRRLGLLFIAHDLHVVRHLCTRVLVMHRGVVLEEGPAEVVLGAPAHPYTQALVAAAPRLEEALSRHRP